MAYTRTFLILIYLSAITSIKLPSYITLCHKQDPNINECLLNAFEATRPHLKNGIRDFGIPPVVPLVIPKLSINLGDFRSTYINSHLYHVDEFQIDNINLDLENNKIDIDIFYPRFRMESTYNIKGKLLFFDLDSTGPFIANFTNFGVQLKMSGKRHIKQSKPFVEFDRVDMNIVLGKLRISMDNLFKDNKELNDQTNKVINENIDDIIIEFSPVIKAVIQDVIISLIGKVFTKYSIDELFPN